MTPFRGIVITNEIEKHNNLEAAAEILNRELRNIYNNEHHKLRDIIKTKHLIQGECNIIEFLIKFYEKVLFGVSKFSIQQIMVRVGMTDKKMSLAPRLIHQFVFSRSFSSLPIYILF